MGGSRGWELNYDTHAGLYNDRGGQYITAVSDVAVRQAEIKGAAPASSPEQGSRRLRLKRAAVVLAPAAAGVVLVVV